MSMDTAEKTRGRVVEERARRRRRDDLGSSRHRQLAVDSSKFDPNFTYRIINDEPGRIHALTKQDDWDIVTNGEIGDRDPKEKGVGSAVEFVVERSSGKKGVLVRKPKDYYEQDKAKEQGQITARMSDIKRGDHKDPEALSGPHAYVPQGGINIREGGRG